MLWLDRLDRGDDRHQKREVNVSFDLLRDQVWAFILGVLAIAAPFLIWYWQKEKKRLNYSVAARVPIVRTGKVGIAGIAVTFNGSPVKDADILLIEIQNVGNRPITQTDFEGPLTVEFEEDILAADVLRTYPAGMSHSISFVGKTATVSSHLLNPRDSVLLRFLVHGQGKNVRVFGRIAGVAAIQDGQKASRLEVTLGVLSMVALFGSMLGGVFLTGRPLREFFDIRPAEVPYVIAMVTSLACFAAIAFRSFIRTARPIRP